MSRVTAASTPWWIERGGVEGRGRDVEAGIGGEVDQLVAQVRPVERHVEGEAVDPAAGAGLVGPGALGPQRHEGGAQQVLLHEVGEVRHVAGPR